jgi:hypothetical protein
LCCVLLKPSLSVELRSFQILAHLEFPALVITGSWAPLHTLRAWSSGYSACFLAMKSSKGDRQGTQQLHSVYSFGSQGSRQQQQQEEETPLSPSILSQSVRSEDTTSRSMTTQVVTLALAMSEAPSQVQTRAHTPARVPIPSSPSPPSPFSPHPPGDLSTAPTSFVTAPPTIVSRTTDSGDDGHMPGMRDDTEHYPPPHAGVRPSLI